MELIVVGAQSGDEGKGKFTDFFGIDADAVVRFQGGPHTGHTVVDEEREYRFIQLPAGVHRGTRGILGNGCVIEPVDLLKEMSELGVPIQSERLLISETCHVVMPYHRRQDEGLERWRGSQVATSQTTGIATGVGQLGSTRKGVGPCREDKVARVGIRMVDLLEVDVLRARLEWLLPLKRALLERVHEISLDPADPNFDPDSVTEEYHDLGLRLAPCLGDVSEELRAARQNGLSIVYEGAQSVALDVEHGTYPYCSSGYSSATGVTVGTGTPPGTPFTVVGVAKSYMAQVGGGPLPTELTAETSDYLVERGREIGTVTGRRRRVGWLDLNFVRKAIALDGIGHLCLTNLDVLAGLPEVRIATHYRIDGESVYAYPASLKEASRITPVYETFEGWPIQDWDQVVADGYGSLSEPARRFVEFVAEALDVSLAAISVGRRRDQTLLLNPPTANPEPSYSTAEGLSR